MINFIAGGMMGDFIHSLYVVKQLCAQNNKKANLFIAEGHGDVWRFDLNKTHADLKSLMNNQDYINNFGILNPTEFNEPAVNLTDWRKTLIHTDAGYEKCWSEVLSECYKFQILDEYKWLNASEDAITKNKIVIHRSVHRHNGEFPWKKILDTYKNEEVVFLTSHITEWDVFPHKYGNIRLHQVSTVSDMANAVNSCKMFIGNQSAPFSLACALDVPRLVELDYDPAAFYMDEKKYSNKISWFLNQDKKFNYANSLINL